MEELESIGNQKDMTHIIENRAHNIITSAINLIELINRHYDKETSELLEKKLISSIKGRDQSRFAKSIRKNHEDQ